MIFFRDFFLQLLLQTEPINNSSFISGPFLVVRFDLFPNSTVNKTQLISD